MQPHFPVASFWPTTSITFISVCEPQRERLFYIHELQDLSEALHPMVQESVQSHCTYSRASASGGVLPNFVEEDYVLVAREHFAKRGKLGLRWRGPHRLR